MWLLLAVVILCASAGRILHWQFPDPDDIMRLVQVRDLLGGQGWFDVSQHRVDPLREVPMHWSRLVDLPLVLVIGALTPLVGQAAAEAVALIAIPLLTLLVAMLFTGAVAVRLLGRETGGWAVLVAGLMPLLMHQFQPLRIDHHGWQIACFAACLYGLYERRGMRGPIMAGLAMAWGLTISIEMLPLAALVGAILALRWLRDHNARLDLTHYLQALAGGLVVLHLATRGWTATSAFCDAIGPQHIGFFLVVALGTTALRHARPLPPIALVAGLGATGLAGIALFGWVSPGCVGTPFGALDPVVRDFWYVNVSEGRPLWEQDAMFLFPFAQLLVAFMAALALWARAPRETRAWWLEFLILFAGTLALGMLVVRSLAFASLLATVPFAWLLGIALHRLRTSGGALTRIAVVLATVLLVLPTAPMAIAQNLAPDNAAKPEPEEIAMSSCGLHESARRMATLAPGTVFAPLDIGPTILLETRHGVIATGHHRADKAMRDVIGAFASREDVSRQIVDSYGADYLVLCTDLIEPSIYATRGGKGSLAARLIEGDAPDWLEPMALGGPDTFRAWRVRR
ncbi:hypothetical protein DL238_04010 [Alteriqipengyuania lutimaris]|uniref:AcrB/AcrD/AcrF family protein n=2 Tax=Alteriqipengyuania lutimaris TaxID=1538146 RepID=A0A395LVH8_9SPHN|nr:hypothetical protein DL238_04010 [Alteriqipengyuania lutimaris]